MLNTFVNKSEGDKRVNVALIGQKKFVSPYCLVTQIAYETLSFSCKHGKQCSDEIELRDQQHHFLVPKRTRKSDI